MPDAYTHADALSICHTGAAFEGATQHNAADCLGGLRAITEMRRRVFCITDPIGPLRIDWLAGVNGTDDGTLTATSASAVTWTPPSGTAGTAITIANGETKLLEGADDDKAIRVTRDSADDLSGVATLNLRPEFNIALAGDDVTPTGAAENVYRGVMLRSHSGAAVTTIKAWVATLGTQAVSDGGQLGAAGAGTITTTDTFADWPDSGYCHIRTAALATREIVYYSSRTTTVLTVPAAGRELLGTTAAAGAADDTLDAVPGVRLALEVAGGGGDIQIIADENTAPAAVVWDTGITSTTGLSHATLAADTNLGLWIHRHVIADATAEAIVTTQIQLQFVAGGTTYNETLTGLYRVGTASLARWDLYLGEDTDPDYTAAPATSSTTVPVVFGLTPPGGADLEYRATLRRRNQYDLASHNLYTRSFIIDAGGNLVTPPPSPPEQVTLTNVAGGEVDIEATYFPDADETAADTWLIYSRADGNTPTPTDTPVTQTMITDSYIGLPRYHLKYAAGPFGSGATLKTLIRTRQAAGPTDSTNTTAVSTTVNTSSPPMPDGRSAIWGARQGQHLTAPTINTTTVVDAGNNIRYIMTPGQTDLWAGAVLIWRLKYDSSDPGNNGWWTTYGIRQEAISGVPVTTPTEVFAWNGQKTIYITAHNSREMKIDVTASTIHFAALRVTDAKVITGSGSDPVVELEYHTLFQVWDPSTWDYATVASLSSFGVLAMKIPWRQRQVVGDFE